MTNKFKYSIIGLFIIFTIILLNATVYASNENIQLIKNTDGKYMVYIKGSDKKDFTYGFSNDEIEPELKLNQEDSDGNKIAVLDVGEVGNPIYMWAKAGEDYLVKAIEIDLGNAANKADLQEAIQITKIIPVDLNKTSTTEKEENGKKITTTVGEIVLENENGSYSFIRIKIPNSEEYNSFIKLAEKISKFNSETDMYSKIEAYSKFFKLYNSLKPDTDSGWEDVEKNIIYQPDDAEDGDEYVVWIRDNETKDIDVQFLTSTKKYSEEKIKEAITTKLPITYDNNMLLIIFVVLMVAIILVLIRINSLKNRKEYKHE